MPCAKLGPEVMGRLSQNHVIQRATVARCFHRDEMRSNTKHFQLHCFDTEDFNCAPIKADAVLCKNSLPIDACFALQKMWLACPCPAK